MLTAIQAAAALRRTADWLEDGSRIGEKCKGAFWRFLAGEPDREEIDGFEVFRADQWCAMGRFLYECGPDEFTDTDHEFWIGGSYQATALERLFDRGKHREVAACLRRRALEIEASMIPDGCGQQLELAEPALA